jgi:hypothetical protein
VTADEKKLHDMWSAPRKNIIKMIKLSDVVVIVFFWVSAPAGGTITWSRIPNNNHMTNIRSEKLETYDEFGM